MQADPELTELLNEVLTSELTAINQYFLDAKMFDHWGYQRLGERFRAESMGEMNDADKLIERILYLEGHPNLQRLGADGRYHVVAVGYVNVASAYQFTWTFGTPGTKTFRVHVPGGPDNVGGYSSTEAINVALPAVTSLPTAPLS